MLKRIYQIVCFLLWSGSAFGQTDADSTQAVADSLKQPPAQPLFDFRPRSTYYLRSLSADSTLLIGARYTSLGEIVECYAGGYFYNLGSAGQPAYASLFGSPMGEMVLSYDELILNHPLSGLADLNMIPVESMGRAGILHSADKPFGHLPLGQTFHVQSATIADNPIRSQVGYRTGANGYDDVDVRLGAKTSERFRLDLGGVIRGYDGHLRNSLYDGHQINLKADRRLGANWLLRYLLLANQHAANLPIPQPPVGFSKIVFPLQKEKRTDHALVLRRCDALTAVLQYTLMESDWRDQSRAVFNAQHDARSLRYTAEWAPLAGRLNWRSGLTGWTTSLNSNSWGKHGDWQSGLYSSIDARITDKLRGYGRLTVEKNSRFQPQALPEINLFWSFDSTMKMTLWANRGMIYPSLEARFSRGALAWGNSDLQPGEYQQAGLALEKRSSNVMAAGAVTLRRNLSQIAAQFDGERVVFANLPDYSLATVDLQTQIQLNRWLITFKGQTHWQFSSPPLVTNRPDWYLQSFVQYHLIQFKGDLNARLRVGAYLLGESRAPIPYHAAFSPQTAAISPQIYPYLHALLHYHSAEVFFAYENFIGADVQYVYGYSMPQQWFRWGFVWHFVD